MPRRLTTKTNSNSTTCSTSKPTTKPTNKPARSKTSAARAITRLRRLLALTPRTPDQLHRFLRHNLNLHIPRTPAVETSAAPFDYLVHTFFEGRFDPRLASLPPAASASNDCVVWAARGTGKTFLGALATVLDLVFKPGISVRILGGSLEQSLRMHEHLAAFFSLPRFAPLLAKPITSRTVLLKNTSRASVLSASQTSVRGVRVQKLRCDEVDLFSQAIWSAAQLTTRSADIPGPWGDRVRPAVEALSTMHVPGGIMSSLIDDAPANPGRARVFRWSILDVLDRCTDEHDCRSCVIQTSCKGSVKARDQRIDSAHDQAHAEAHPRTLPPPRPGFVPIADAVAMRIRVDALTWASEMMCESPGSRDTVFPMLSVDHHRFPDRSPPDQPALALPHDAALHGRWLAGVDFGHRTSAVILAHLDSHGVLRVVRERVAQDDLLPDLIDALKRWNAQLNAAHTNHPAIELVGADPAGHARNPVTGRSAIADLVAAGFAVRAGRVPTEAGLALIRARLESPTPTLRVSSQCPNLFSALAALRYRPASSAAKRSKPSVIFKDGPDHPCDALRYLITALDRLKPAEHRNY
ncbi:MAG: hypothetical protein KF768_11665 [Phycisphaeraceae bacterium]|nr:hypothetical protein [Phycisphaeraceae bacterium]